MFVSSVVPNVLINIGQLSSVNKYSNWQTNDFSLFETDLDVMLKALS